ncbi:MAG: FlgD immunoglobulin-like domain containing protein [bacterium]
MRSFPNPFSAMTRIRFETAERTVVTLRIYDASGRLVRTLLDADTPPGRHTVAWDGKTELGRAAASGVYFCRLCTGRVSEVRKITLLK